MIESVKSAELRSRFTGTRARLINAYAHRAGRASHGRKARMLAAGEARQQAWIERARRASK